MHCKIRLRLLAVLVFPTWTAWAQAPAVLMARADSTYDAFNSGAALPHYLGVLRQHAGDYAALWKAARCEIDLGRQAAEKELKKRHFRLADSLARRCVTLHPDSAEGHFILAMAIGRLAEYEGGKEKIRLSREIKAEAEKTLAISPRHDGAYHILGRWNYEIATLSWMLKAFAKIIYGGVPPGASVQQAVRLFGKAVEIAPQKPVHRLEYARTLIHLKEYARARDQLEACLALKPVYWDDPMNQREAANLLEHIKAK